MPHSTLLKHLPQVPRLRGELSPTGLQAGRAPLHYRDIMLLAKQVAEVRVELTALSGLAYETSEAYHIASTPRQSAVVLGTHRVNHHYHSLNIVLFFFAA